MVVNVDEAPERGPSEGPFGAASQSLTPSMRPRGGSLGVNRMRLKKGQTACPFHYHLREDEAFFVLSGRGVLRYGDDLREIRAGDCISCPAGTQPKLSFEIATTTSSSTHPSWSSRQSEKWSPQLAARAV